MEEEVQKTMTARNDIKNHSISSKKYASIAKSQSICKELLLIFLYLNKE